MKQRKAKHIGEGHSTFFGTKVPYFLIGLALGFRDLGVGLYEGITGIITAPIEGVQKDGALGLFTGIGKGVAGAILKPVV